MDSLLKKSTRSPRETVGMTESPGVRRSRGMDSKLLFMYIILRTHLLFLNSFQQFLFNKTKKKNSREFSILKGKNFVVGNFY